MKKSKKRSLLSSLLAVMLIICMMSMFACGDTSEEGSGNGDTAVSKYTITVSGSITGGEVESSHVQTEAGTLITLIVKPQTGYLLVDGSLKYNTTVVSAGTDGAYTFTMPEEDVTISAEFSKNLHAIDVNSSIENGTITTSATSAGYGDKVTVTVTADEGYVLSSNSLKFNTTTIYASGGTYSFTMPNEAVTITGAFEVKSTAIYVTNGKVNQENEVPTNVGNYDYGTVVTVTADDITGQTFTAWQANDAITDLTAKSFTYTVGYSDMSFIAEFEASAYTISVENGTIVDPQTEYNHNDSVTITPTVPTGKEFTYWVINDDDTIKETDAEYTFTVTEDIKFTANFKDYNDEVVTSMYTVSAGGSLGEGTYFEGETVTVRFNQDVPTNSKDIEAVAQYGWEDQDGNLYVGNSATVENISKDLTFTPTYKFAASSDYFYVANDSDRGLRLNMDRYLHGGMDWVSDAASTPSLFTAAGSDYYTDVDYLKVFMYDSQDSELPVAEFKMIYDTTSGKYEMTSFDGDYITYGSPGWNATTSSSSAGNTQGFGFINITPYQGNSTYYKDDECFITFIDNVYSNFDLNATYYFGSQVIAKADGEVQDSDVARGELGICMSDVFGSNYKFVDIENGTGSGVYKTTETATAECVLQDGEVFDGWYDDSDSFISSSNPYSFTPSAHVTYTAKTSAATYNDITISSMGNGTVTVDGGATQAIAGSTVILNVTPDSGYILESGTLKANDTVILSDGGVYSFTMPTEAVTITATFKEVSADAVTVTVEGGTLTNGLSEEVYEIGDSVTVTYTAYDPTDTESVVKTFVGWYVDGVEVSTNTTYTFDASETVTVTAVHKFFSSTALAYYDGTYLNMDRLSYSDGTKNPDYNSIFGNTKSYSILDHADVDYLKIYFYTDYTQDAVVEAKLTVDENDKPILIYEKADGTQITVDSNSSWGTNIKGYTGFNVNSAWAGTGSYSEDEKMSVWFEAILGDAFTADSTAFYVGSQIISSNDAVLDGDVAIYTAKSFTCAA